MHNLTRTAGANIMGWTSFTNTNKKEVIAEIKSMYPSDMEWSLAGNNLWGLFELQNDTAKYVKGQKVILLYLLQSCGKNAYGYKDLCESMSPYHYNCPLKFLKAAVVESPEWREDVVKYHSSKGTMRGLVASIKIGDIIKLKNCKIKEVKVVATNPLRAAAMNTHVVYRIPSKFIDMSQY